MTTLVIGSGLVGSQVARILVERGEKPVLMDAAAQPQAIGQIVDLGNVTTDRGRRAAAAVDRRCAAHPRHHQDRAHRGQSAADARRAEGAVFGDQPQHHGHRERAGGRARDGPQARRRVELERAQSLSRRRRGRRRVRQGGSLPAADHVLFRHQAGGREPRPQLREVVRDRVRRPALRRGVRAVERRWRRRAFERRARGDAATRSPARRRWCRPARWSGSIPRTRRAAR